MKILIVEDSERLRASLGRGLRLAGYAVDDCADGEAALRRAASADYDVIVLDLMLPKLDGWTVLERLRQALNPVHVLILSARDEVEDRVRGLRMGADDYLVKPFSFDELLARIDALTRRKQGRKQPEIAVGPIVIDTARKLVRRGQQVIDLTAREYRLLEYLAFHLGRPVSREEIARHIYPEDREVMSNAIDSAICTLRAKLDERGEGSLIQTRRGLGYCLLDPAAAEQTS